MNKKQDKALDSLLKAIDALKRKLDAARPLAGREILQAIDTEYTYDSNRIEGNTLTLRETDIIVNKGITVGGKSMREHLEAANHHEAVAFIRELAQEQTSLSERTVKEVHALILRGIDR
jgi:Fic family protein